jgi:hypothetical protein
VNGQIAPMQVIQMAMFAILPEIARTSRPLQPV